MSSKNDSDFRNAAAPIEIGEDTFLVPSSSGEYVKVKMVDDDPTITAQLPAVGWGQP